MKLRHRILGATGAILVLAIAWLAITISHDSPCPAPASLADEAERMQAIVRRCYGSSDVLTNEQIARPVAADDEVLVKVHAAALNPFDWHAMTGKPYLIRFSLGLGAPDHPGMGGDFAGTVDSVGRNVSRFKPGDEVFGSRRGALAQFVAVREQGTLARKPRELTFEQAAAVPLAAITALQGLRDKGRIQAGQKVLVNGASGGVGTFAVQIAKSFGAEVTGVCSTRNVELVRSIGADHVIDYAQENFTQGAARYDLILDTVGNHALLALRGVLRPKGRLVRVGGPKRDPWIGPLTRRFKAALVSPFVEEELISFLARLNADDLSYLAELARAGKMRPVIDRRYALRDVPAALEYLHQGHARGKVIVLAE